MLTQEQKYQLNTLMDYRDDICKMMFHIERILKHHFPQQFDLAYQHWIPQILTALDNDTKWLPRGQFSFQDTIDHIQDNADNGSGVSKFIK